MLTHKVPVGLTAFGKNEDNRPVVVSDVSAAIRCIRPEVRLVCLVEGHDSFIRALSGIVAFVVEKRHLKMFFAGDLLDGPEIFVGVSVAWPIPIHGKTGDAHADGFINLATDHVWILAGITNVNVSRVAKPWHICRQYLGTASGIPSLKHAGHIVAAGG